MNWIAAFSLSTKPTAYRKAVEWRAFSWLVSRAKSDRKRYTLEQILFRLQHRGAVHKVEFFSAMANSLPRWLTFSISSLMLLSVANSLVRADNDSHPWRSSDQFAET